MPSAFTRARPLLVAIAALGLPAGAAGDETAVHTRFALIRQAAPAMHRLEGEIQGSAGGFYGGVRGRGEQDGDDAEAAVFAGFRREEALDLRYNYRLGLLGRDPDGRLSVELGRSVTSNLRFGARLNVDDALESGSAEARAQVELGEATSLSGRVGQAIDLDGDGEGGGDVSAQVRLLRRFTPRRAELAMEANTDPKALVVFRMRF